MYIRNVRYGWIRRYLLPVRSPIASFVKQPSHPLLFTNSVTVAVVFFFSSMTFLEGKGITEARERVEAVRCTFLIFLADVLTLMRLVIHRYSIITLRFIAFLGLCADPAS